MVCLTLPWREVDTNFQFRAETGFGYRLPTMTSVPRPLVLGGDAGHDAGPDDVLRSRLPPHVIVKAARKAAVLPTPSVTITSQVPVGTRSDLAPACT